MLQWWIDGWSSCNFKWAFCRPPWTLSKQMFRRGRQVFQVGQAPSGPTVIRPLVRKWENHCQSAMLSSVSPWWRQLWPADELCWSSDHHRRPPCSSTWVDVHPPSTLYHKHRHIQTHKHTHTHTHTQLHAVWFSVISVIVFQFQFQL